LNNSSIFARNRIVFPFHQNTYNCLSNKNELSLTEPDAYCQKWFAENHDLNHFFFTKSCTQSLELSIMLLDLPEGAEVIMPSYAFVSLANAVNNMGCNVVFVDCEKDTMNIDPLAIKAAISPKTKAVISINYGGVSCDYQKIKEICTDNQLYLIEDNAHGVLGKYKNDYLGTQGDISTFSFDYLKNFTCFQGGGIAINNKDLLERFYIVSEFGTNRRTYLNGKGNFYEWVGRGTNALVAAPLISLLAPQLEIAHDIVKQFNSNWTHYQRQLQALEKKGLIELSKTPQYAERSAHMFWFKTANLEERTRLIKHLAKKGVTSMSHYVPLHSSKYGQQVAEFRGSDNFTSQESQKLIRLPLYYSLRSQEIEKIVDSVNSFYL